MFPSRLVTPNKDMEPVQPSAVVPVDMTEEDEGTENNDDSSPPLKKQDAVSRAIDMFWQSGGRFLKRYETIIKIVFLIALNIGIGVYLLFASLYWVHEGASQWEWCDGYGFLIILLTSTYLLLLYYLVLKPYLGEAVYERCFVHVLTFWDSFWKRSVVFRGIVYLLPLVALAIYLAIDTAGNRERLISIGGLIIILILGFIFSKHPGQIHWRPVYWGLALQFIFGLVTIRWRTGREVLQCFGDKVSLFLSYSYNGSSFVYGDFLIYEKHVFAFQFLSVIFFFSFVISILFYLGVLQAIVMKLGWLLQKSCGTTVCESVNAAASIFLGQSEAPLVIKPYMKNMTRSEMHAVMTAGFGTVSGSVFAAFIGFGISPGHLVTASVMSAPASICFSKLFYPETEVSKTTVENIVIDEGTDTSVLDAATRGALAAVEIVMGIISNLVAYLASIAFFDAVLLWTFELLGYPGWNFQVILGYIFLPLAYVMGVAPDECQEVATLIGLKTIVNEFIAYQELGKLTTTCAISIRSEAIATYALCGFANPGSVGIQVGALSMMAPNQRPNITSVAFRALIAGCACSFLTACIAGVLLPEDSFDDFISTPRDCTYET